MALGIKQILYINFNDKMVFSTNFLSSVFANARILYKSIRNQTTQTASEQIDPATDMNVKKIKSKKVLTLDIANEKLVNMEYAVRGKILARAKELQAELNQGEQKPFKEIILTNLGDVQAMGQSPITFIRQLATVALYPTLMDSPHFPTDVKKRVKLIRNDCLGHSLGSYTHTQGIQSIRKHIAEYIYIRDNGEKEVDKDDIFLGDGCTHLIKAALSLFNQEFNGKPTGVMISVPQYPLYSATLTAMGLYKIDYYLDEDNNWALKSKELQRALDEARQFCEPRVLVVINPGNPTGQVLPRKCLEDTIKFAFREGLFIFADEVYQDNVYDEDSEFHSIRKVMIEMGMPYSTMELLSFHSASKGFAGECGFRGGYLELFNIDNEVKDELLKLMSVGLCSNSVGQVILDGIICPPKETDVSYELYQQEKCCVLNSLSEKADKTTRLLNAIEGVKCNTVQGALYAFPKINLPEKFVNLAQKNNMKPDEFFCLQFLNEKGICVVPGSGFGQKPGTYHFRTTILPPIKQLEFMVKQLKDFMKKVNEK